MIESGILLISVIISLQLQLPLQYNGKILFFILFSEVITEDKYIFASSLHIFTCTVIGVNVLPDISWVDKEGTAFSSDDEIQVIPGSLNGNMVISLLQVSSTKLQEMDTTFLLTCLVKSGEYTIDSPFVESSFTVTKLDFGIGMFSFRFYKTSIAI